MGFKADGVDLGKVPGSLGTPRLKSGEENRLKQL